MKILEMNVPEQKLADTDRKVPGTPKRPTWLKHGGPWGEAGGRSAGSWAKTGYYRDFQEFSQGPMEGH